MGLGPDAAGPAGLELARKLVDGRRLPMELLVRAAALRPEAAQPLAAPWERQRMVLVPLGLAIAAAVLEAAGVAAARQCATPDALFGLMASRAPAALLARPSDQMPRQIAEGTGAPALRTALFDPEPEALARLVGATLLYAGWRIASADGARGVDAVAADAAAALNAALASMPHSVDEFEVLLLHS